MSREYYSRGNGEPQSKKIPASAGMLFFSTILIKSFAPYFQNLNFES